LIFAATASPQVKIAQIAPLFESVPPKLYGGTERIVAYLSDALVEFGHDVTLFASGESASAAKLITARDQALRLDPASNKSGLAAHLSMLHDVRRFAKDFDVLHFHIDLIHFPIFEEIADRTVTTLHGRLDLLDLKPFFRRWDGFPLVSISNAQRFPLPTANWLGTVHHGLPLGLIAPPPAPRGDYLAFLGRISPEKRPDRAIQIAVAAGLPLRIAAKLDNADREYFQEAIEPLLDNPLVEFVGEIGDSQKSDFLGEAKALLFPIDWPEPFGLVMIEAMAAGTPTIAYLHGSVPEIIDQGETGLVVRSLSQAVNAVELVGTLDRKKIRRTFERRFSAEAMARNYLRLYDRIAEQRAQLDLANAIGGNFADATLELESRRLQ